MKKFDLILEGLGILALIILIGSTFAFVALTCPPAAAASAWLVAGVMAIISAFQAYQLFKLFK